MPETRSSSLGRGRRPAGSDTRGAIVEAARQSFAEQGYDATSLRGIARRAGVDPSLVHHYFAGKAALFAQTMAMGIDPGQIVRRIVAGDRGAVGERAVRSFLAIWDSPAQRARFVALLRAAVTHEEAARSLREFLVREVFGQIVLGVRPAGAAPGPLSETERLRAGLAAAQMIGLATMRYVVGLPAIAEAGVEDLVPPVAATLQRYLVPDVGPE